MAARYWVGGTATWDTTAGTKWALTDGGAGGQSVPGTADTVFFTALSGAVTVTWTTASATVVSINSTGFTGTHATGGNSKTLNGSGTVWFSPVTCTITGAATMTVSYPGAIGVNVTCNHAAPSVANSVSFSFIPVGGTATYPLTLSGTGFRGLNFAGPQNLPSVSGTISVYGNVSLPSAGVFTGFAPTFLAASTFTSNTRTIGNTTVNAPGETVLTSAALTLGVTNTFTLTAGTLSVGGPFSTGTFSSTNTNTRAIAFGANNIALTGTSLGATLLSMADATNFTYTGTGGFTRNMVAITTFDFGTTGGGSTTNAPNLTLTGGTNNASFNTGGWFRNFNCSSASSSVLGTFNLAGNLTINPSGSYNAFNPTFRATTSFNTLGNPSFGVITVNGAGITVSLSSTGGGTTAITNIVLTEGTLNITTNLSSGGFSSSNSNVRALTLTAGIIFTISTSGTSAWNTATSTNLTFTPNTATISMTSGSAKTFNGGGLTYYNLRQGGAGTLTISGSNTFNDITNTVQPNTVTFTAGTTQTVSNFSLSGTAASKITINSSSAGTQFTLSKASGTVTAQNLRIQDSNATGGAVWYASNSTNLGNTTGWNFQSPNMFAFLI